MLYLGVRSGRSFLATGERGRFPKEGASEKRGRSVEVQQLDKRMRCSNGKSPLHLEDSAGTWYQWKPPLGLGFPICQMSRVSISHGAGSRKLGDSVQQKRLKSGLWAQPTQVQGQLYYSRAVRVWARQSMSLGSSCLVHKTSDKGESVPTWQDFRKSVRSSYTLKQRRSVPGGY